MGLRKGALVTTDWDMLAVFSTILLLCFRAKLAFVGFRFSIILLIRCCCFETPEC